MAEAGGPQGRFSLRLTGTSVHVDGHNNRPTSRSSQPCYLEVVTSSEQAPTMTPATPGAAATGPKLPALARRLPGSRG